MNLYSFGLVWHEIDVEITTHDCKEYMVDIGSYSEHDKFCHFVIDRLQELSEKIWSKVDMYFDKDNYRANFYLSPNLYQWIAPRLDSLFMQFVSAYREENLAAIKNALA